MSAVLVVRNLFRNLNSFPLGSKRFEVDWDRFQGRSKQGIQGCWNGKWISSEKRKEWPLKCIMTRIAPGTYLASFSRQVGEFFSVGYEIQLSVLEERERFQIEGAADFGRFSGGVHHLKGSGTVSSVECEYRSARDNGKIKLARSREGD